MILELKPATRLEQQLIMTPQLQQAIKLLQLSRHELVETIQAELNDNPVLEKVESSAGEKEAPGWEAYFDYYRYRQTRGFASEPGEAADYENFTPGILSLREHLLQQLLLTALSEADKVVGQTIAGSLDQNGYLAASVEELAGMSGAGVDRVRRVLSLMQTFDPPGVCAADLNQCLLIQLQQQGLEEPVVSAIVKDHLGSLERKNYKAICRALKIKVKDVVAAVAVIRTLEPKPARPFGDAVARTIEPDLFVSKIKGEYVIRLNDGGLPQLRISPQYQNMLIHKGATPKAVADFVRDKIRAAEWLIGCIYQRQRTIYRVMESILGYQMDFFEQGVSRMRPMVLRDVADDLGLSESTVSRVTSRKYVQTPQGIFSLKYFFSSAVDGAGGESVAATAVKEKIKKIIAGEDPVKPLSDEQVARVLKDRGIRIARRTVAKYREALGILAASRRKQF